PTSERDSDPIRFDPGSRDPRIGEELDELTTSAAAVENRARRRAKEFDVLPLAIPDRLLGPAEFLLEAGVEAVRKRMRRFRPQDGRRGARRLEGGDAGLQDVGLSREPPLGFLEIPAQRGERSSDRPRAL